MSDPEEIAARDQSEADAREWASSVEQADFTEPNPHPEGTFLAQQWELRRAIGSFVDAVRDGTWRNR